MRAYNGLFDNRPIRYTYKRPMDNFNSITDKIWSHFHHLQFRFYEHTEQISKDVKSECYSMKDIENYIALGKF